ADDARVHRAGVEGPVLGIAARAHRVGKGDARLRKHVLGENQLHHRGHVLRPRQHADVRGDAALLSSALDQNTRSRLPHVRAPRIETEHEQRGDDYHGDDHPLAPEHDVEKVAQAGFLACIDALVAHGVVWTGTLSLKYSYVAERLAICQPLNTRSTG